MSKDQIETEVVPCNLANADTVKAREDFYYTTLELAQVRATMAAKKELHNSYKAHVNQESIKMANIITDKMIFDAFEKVKLIPVDTISPEEKEAIENIGANLIKTLNSTKEARMEVYETMQNIISQHNE